MTPTSTDVNQFTSRITLVLFLDRRRPTKRRTIIIRHFIVYDRLQMVRTLVPESYDRYRLSRARRGRDDRTNGSRTNSRHAYRVDIRTYTRASRWNARARGLLLTGDRFDARSAPLGEQLSETIAAVRLLIPGRKTLSGQRSVAIAARKAFPVPRFVFICHATASDYLLHKHNGGQRDCRLNINRSGASEAEYVSARNAFKF